MTPLTIEPEAEADICDAYDWYDKQRPGLGDDFILCVEVGLQNAQQRPKSFPKIYKSVRRILIHRFPYAILFVEQKAMVTVIAVFHVRRDPNSWQKRSQ